MKECDILWDKTYSDLCYTFSRGQDPQLPRIYTRGSGYSSLAEVCSLLSASSLQYSSVRCGGKLLFRLETARVWR